MSASAYTSDVNRAVPREPAGLLVQEAFSTREEIRQRGEESIRAMLDSRVTLDEAFACLARGEYQGTMVEAELRLLRRLLAR